MAKNLPLFDSHVAEETLQGYGNMDQRVDDRTIYCTPAPLAASTAFREGTRRIQLLFDTRGSFLDDKSRFSLQSNESHQSLHSESELDLTNELRKLNFNYSLDPMLPLGKPTVGPASAGDSGPDLIQFSKMAATVSTELGSEDGEQDKSDVSSRSSMGLIPSDMLNELSASMLPLTAPKPDRASKRTEAASVTSDSKERTTSGAAETVDWLESSQPCPPRDKTRGDSTDWSDSSKQDSKDMPWKSHLETVKKKPPPQQLTCPLDSGEDQREGRGVRMGGGRGVARGALALFGGQLLGDFKEGDELDHSVHNVELGDDDLRQLDVDFSDLEEDRFSDEGAESGDEDFDFDEPMVAQPGREREGSRAADIGPEARSLQEELACAEGRLGAGEGQESDDDATPVAIQTVNQGDIGLDSCYFRKTSMTFAGDGEDTEITSNRSNSDSVNQQRGAAEGEHLLTKLRRQFMTGVGSENSLKTDDETAIKKSQGRADRQEAQGAEERDTDRSDLPLPVGLEKSNGDQHNKSSGQPAHHMAKSDGGERNKSSGQPAHHTAKSDGGERNKSSGQGAHHTGKSDGGERNKSSGQPAHHTAKAQQTAAGSFLQASSDNSESGGGKTSVEEDKPGVRFVSGADDVNNISPCADMSSIIAHGPAGPDKEQGLKPEYFMPTSNSTLLHDSTVISHQALEGSTFNMEEIFKSKTEVARRKSDPLQLDASLQNPFEDNFRGSLGSFGLDQEEHSDQSFFPAGSSAKTMGLGQDKPATKHNLEVLDFQYKPLSAAINQDPTSDCKTSFDGPFRKPRLPVSLKKIETNETTSTKKNKANDNAAFPGMDDDTKSELEKELRELGIDLGDDNFKPAESARAMLESDEKEFERENKFSEHHQLAVAASGLSWGSDDSMFSGYLGGDDQPDNLEASIGTYMLRRTEALGSLGDDPRAPRPEFGKPVCSPPHARFPVKLMSPPSTASSITSVDSRTDGEGDEDGDETLVSFDSSPASTAEVSTPTKETQPTLEAEGSRRIADSAEMTALKEELSLLLLDLTSGGDELSTEDALSMSAISEFIKNHSFSKPSDFASAILQLSKKSKEAGKGSATKRGPAHAVTSSPTTKGSRLPVRLGSKASQSKVRYPSLKPKDPDSEEKSSARNRSVSVCNISCSSVSEISVFDSSQCVKEMTGKRSNHPKTDTDKKASESLKRAPDFSRQRSKNSTLSSGVFSSDNNSLMSSSDTRAKFSQGDVSLECEASVDKVSNVKAAGNTVQGSLLLQASKIISNINLSKQLDPNDVSIGPDKNKPVVGKVKSAEHERREFSFGPGDSGLSDLKVATFKTSAPIPIDFTGADVSECPARALEPSCLKSAESSSGPKQIVLYTPPQKLTASSNKADTGSSPECSIIFKDDTFQEPQSPKSSQHQHHVPDGMEGQWSPRLSTTPAGQQGPRQQALGTDSCHWMESRPFHPVQNGNAVVVKEGQPKSAVTGPTAVEKLVSMQATGVLKTQDQIAESAQPKQPTLLTGTSLLKTEFAQKYLISRGAPQLSQELKNSWTTVPKHCPGPGDRPAEFHKQQGQQLDLQRIPPDHEFSDRDRHSPPSNGRLETLSEQWHDHVFKVPASTVRPAVRRSQLPAMDDTGLSHYCELDQDLGQTTMVGGEYSALGSFWGKSPLHQSTPAVQVGKMAAVSMVSHLEGRELTTPRSGMVTPRVQRQLIDIQRAVDFPQFCSLGVSQKLYLPVTNRTVHGMACRFRLLTVLHEGKTVKLEELQHNPFEFKPKLSISAGATESLSVLFVPKRPGEHVCQVEVYAQSLNPTLEATTTIVQIRAVAEVPSIQISPSVEVLQMGEVAWGCTASKIIKMRNTKQSSLPVRLSIWSSGSSVWHCFTFDNSCNTSDVSMISMSSRPESLRHTVVTVTLPGCQSPDQAETVEVALYCRPPSKERSRAISQRPADKIEAKVDIEVDTPVQCLPPLASIVVQASVGMPHLRIDRSHMSMSFKIEPNKNFQESILVDNSGNISMTLALSVTTFPECFKVSPTRLTVAPHNCADITVTFSPSDIDVHRYQSLLLLDVEPEGPSYEIPMEAVVVQPILKPLPLTILSNKSFLSFSGVPLNQSKSLTLGFFNKDSSKTEYASIEVRQTHDCFKLVSVSGDWQQKCEIVIGAREKMPLIIVFCPAAVRGYSGKLIIRKQAHHSSKYSISLYGYGGCSMLALSGACLTNSGQRWLELGPLAVGHNIMQEIVLTNTGNRAAYVRATAFFDMPCKVPVPAGRFGVEPNSFVVAPGSSARVVVAVSPSQREVDLVRDRKEVVAVVRFQHGDEVMRQKYLRASSKDCDGAADTEHLSWNTAFRQMFDSKVQESCKQEGLTVPDSPDDRSAFFEQMKTLCVALLAEPSSRLSTSSPSSSILKASSALPAAARTTPIGLSKSETFRDDASGQFIVPRPPDSGKEEWTVQPVSLTFTVGEASHKLLQLINFSRLPLRFKLKWPRNSVVPEPQEGELQPKSSTSVEVWLHVAWQKRLTELPWKGDLVVSSGGQEKIVRVHIQPSSQQPHLASSSPTASPVSIATSTRSSSSKDTTLSGSGRSLQLASAKIHFDNAALGREEESFLELTNTSTEPMHWKISAFAPPYVKGSDGGSTVQRVSYNVFMVTTSSGDLLPEETVKVPVKFCPKTPGMFNQHWDMEYHPLMLGKVVAQDKVTTKVAFTADVPYTAAAAQVNFNAATSGTEVRPTTAFFKEKLNAPAPGSENMSKRARWEAVDLTTTEAEAAVSSSSRTPLQEKHSNANRTEKSHSAQGLQLMHTDITFNATKVGQVTQLKIEFKNSLEYNVELTVESPQPPFRIMHKSFKITKMRFLKYPIEFCPTKAGTFKDVLVFKAPQLGKTFTALLTAIGV